MEYGGPSYASTASDLAFQEAMEDYLRHVCLALGTLCKYKRHSEGFASFLSTTCAGGLEGVESQDALVHYFEQYLEKVKEDGGKLTSLMTGSSATVHVAHAFARRRREMCTYDSRGKFTQQLIKRSKREQALTSNIEEDIVDADITCLKDSQRRVIMEAFDALHGMAFSVCFQCLMRGDTLRNCQLSRLKLDE